MKHDELIEAGYKPHDGLHIKPADVDEKDKVDIVSQHGRVTMSNITGRNVNWSIVGYYRVRK